MAEYYTILTDAGRALEAASLAGQATYKLKICALGDGANAPDPTRTTLQHEVWRGPINTLAADFNNPTWLIIETHVPPEVGGFTIREFGIYTDTGVLFAIGNYPETYKPVISEGTGVDLVVRPICEVSNAASVTLLTDPSVMMASKSYVDEQIKKVPRRNVGDVYFHQGRSAPFGAVVADGGLVQRDLYPDLWAFVQAQNLVITESAWQTQSTSQGSVGMYSSGDGATTFRLPMMTDFFRGTKDPAKVGTWQKGTLVGYDLNYDGIFSLSLPGMDGVASQSLAGVDSFSIDHYVGAKIAGAAMAVAHTAPGPASTNQGYSGVARPKTLFLLPCIHAYNAIIPDAQADMHGYLAALNGKLDKVTYNACPIFQGYNATAISIPGDVPTVIPVGTVLHSELVNNGNNKIIPLVAGRYVVSLTMHGAYTLTADTVITSVGIYLYKNGTQIGVGSRGIGSTNSTLVSGNALNAIVDLNGTTDALTFSIISSPKPITLAATQFRVCVYLLRGI